MINLTGSNERIYQEVPGRYYVLIRKGVSLKKYYKINDVISDKDNLSSNGDELAVYSDKNKLIEKWTRIEGSWEIL